MAQAIARFSRRYDWKRWTDGRVYRAVKGKDFDCNPEGFRSTLYSKARLLGIQVKCSLVGKSVEFQFVKE